VYSLLQGSRILDLRERYVLGQNMMDRQMQVQGRHYSIYIYI